MTVGIAYEQYSNVLPPRERERERERERQRGWGERRNKFSSFVLKTSVSF